MDPSTTLSLSVTLAVLVAAVTHATWNAIAHSIKDQTLAFALIGVGGIVVAIPLIIVTATPEAGCWPYLMGSVVIHVFYNLLLMRCYRLGEFGQVYPLARGTSPLVVTILAAIFVHEHLALPQIAGVLIVSAGLATLVLAGRRPGRAAFLAAVGTGLTIAGYTTIDGVGVRLSGSPVGYIGWLMLLESLCVPMFALARRRDVLLKQPPRILLGGLAAGGLSVLAYGLVLWAQTRGALAPIAALRETSVIFGAIIGTLIFREPFGRTRIAATVLVVSGIVLLSVGLTPTGTWTRIWGCPAVQGSAGHRVEWPTDLFLPSETRRMRIRIKKARLRHYFVTYRHHERTQSQCFIISIFSTGTGHQRAVLSGRCSS